MRATVAVIAVLALVCAAAAEDAVKKEMAQLEGEWSMVSGEADGSSMPKEMVSTGKRVAKDGVTTITIGGGLYFKAKLTIDPPQKPKTLQLTMHQGPAHGDTHLC